jgi:hypothetical protein
MRPSFKIPPMDGKWIAGASKSKIFFLEHPEKEECCGYLFQ